MQHTLREGCVTAMGAVWSEAGGALVALGEGPLCDTQLAEETSAAGDTMRLVGDELCMCVCVCV